MNQTLTQSNGPVVILHLSDLHFDGNEGHQGSIGRSSVFDALMNEIKSLEKDWSPSVVCISGDIAYQNKQSGYEEAIEWLKKLLLELSIEREGVFVCPGNHDVDREKASFLVRPHDVGEADRVLRLPIPDHYKSLFVRYEEFCKALRLLPYDFNDSQEYFVGSREYKNINFVCNNSCWCSMDEEDENSLWLGQNFIKSLKLPLILNLDNQITISLMHHPKESYHVNERITRDQRIATLDYLASISHIILTGHTHGSPRKPDILHDNAIIFSGGCYESERYQNSYSLIRLWPERLYLDIKQYEWDVVRSSWSVFYEESNYKLRIKETLERRDYQFTEKIKQEVEAKTERECSQTEIEEIYNVIRHHVDSLDYSEAIKVYEDKRDILDSSKDKYKDLVMKIEILIAEAKDE